MTKNDSGSENLLNFDFDNDFPLSDHVVLKWFHRHYRTRTQRFNRKVRHLNCALIEFKPVHSPEEPSQLVFWIPMWNAFNMWCAANFALKKSSLLSCSSVTLTTLRQPTNTSIHPSFVIPHRNLIPAQWNTISRKQPDLRKNSWKITNQRPLKESHQFTLLTFSGAHSEKEEV